MTFRRPQYDLYLASDPETAHRVTVLHYDQLAAEAQAHSYGLPVDPSEAPLAHSTLYVWCAAKRMGLYKEPFPRFKTDDCLGFTAVTKDDGQEAGEPVDPTQPAPGITSP